MADAVAFDPGAVLAVAAAIETAGRALAPTACPAPVDVVAAGYDVAAAIDDFGRLTDEACGRARAEAQVYTTALRRVVEAAVAADRWAG